MGLHMYIQRNSENIIGSIQRMERWWEPWNLYVITSGKKKSCLCSTHPFLANSPDCEVNTMVKQSLWFNVTWFILQLWQIGKGRVQVKTFCLNVLPQTVKNLPAMQETQVWSLGQEDPGVGNGNLLQYFCLEKSHGQRSLEGYSPLGRKESDTTEWLSTAQHRNHVFSLHPIRRWLMSACAMIGAINVDWLAQMVSATCLHCKVIFSLIRKGHWTHAIWEIYDKITAHVIKEGETVPY